MERWQTIPLGNLCDLVGGGTPSKSHKAFYEGDIPWATVRDMRQDVITTTEFRITQEAVASSTTNIIPAGNVVIATRVGLGKVCFVGQDTAINQDLRGVIPKDKKQLNVRFLYWWLKSIARKIEHAGTGATVQGVKLQFIQSLAMPVLPLPEQKRIVAILDEAFSGIDAAMANTEKNLANARELFESYLNAIFNQAGAGWEEQSLAQVCQINPQKKEVKSKLDDNTLVSFVPMEQLGLYSKVIGLEIAKPLGKVYGSYTYFAENDVLLAKITPCFENGKLGIARGLSNGVGFGSSEFIVFRCKDCIIPDYLFYFLSNSTLRKSGARVMTGAVGHKRIPMDFIESYKLPIPTIPEQKRIVAQLDELSAASKRLEALYKQKQKALEELKQALLHKAFSGDLTAQPEPLEQITTA